MKGFQRIISGMLAFCLVVSMLPVDAWATETEPLETAGLQETTAETEITATTETTAAPTEETNPESTTGTTAPGMTGPAETEPSETEETRIPELETVPVSTDVVEEMDSAVWSGTEAVYSTSSKQLTSVVRTFPNGYTDTHSFTYNAEGLVAEVVFQQVQGDYCYESRQTMVYDAYGRLIEVWMPSVEWMTGPQRTYTYNNAGQLITSTYTEGSTSRTTYKYNAAGRRISAVTEFDTGTETWTYQYDASGNLVGAQIRSEYVDGTKRTDSYTYECDSQHRIIEASGTFNGAAEQHTYNYNRLPFVCHTYSSAYYTFDSTDVTLQDIEGNTIWTLGGIINPRYTQNAEGYLTKITEDGYDGTGSVITFTYEGEEEPELTGWRKAYYDFIVADKNAGYSSENGGNSLVGTWDDSVTYELVYLNGDEVPELYIIYQYDVFSHSHDDKLIMYVEGDICEKSFNGAWLRYENNCIVDVIRKVGNSHESNEIMQIDNGAWSTISLGVRFYDAIYDKWDCKWDNASVTEEEYAQCLAEWIDVDVAQNTGSGKVYDYEGILEWLSSYEELHHLTTGSGSVSYVAKTGQDLRIPVYLYRGDEKVTDWTRPQCSVENAETGLSYVTGEVTGDGGYMLLFKATDPGAFPVVIRDEKTNATLKLTVYVEQAEVLQYLDNSAIEINGGGSAYAYYIGRPEQTYHYTVGETDGVSRSNEKGIFRVPLGTFRQTGSTAVTVRITQTEDEVFLPEYCFSSLVTVTPLSFSQKWKASFSGSVGAKIGPQADLKLGLVKAEALLGYGLGAEVEAGVAMSISRTREGENEKWKFISEKKLGGDVTAKSGISGEVLKSKITVLESSVGVAFSSNGTYGLEIENFDAQNPSHQKKMATFLLGEALFVNPGNLFLQPLYQHLTQSVYDTDDVVTLCGSSVSLSGTLGADAGKIEVADVELFTAAKSEVEIAGALSEKVYTDGTSESSTSYTTGINLAFVCGDLLSDGSTAAKGAMLGMDFLGKDVEITAKHSPKGYSVESTALSASDPGVDVLFSGEHNLSNYNTYRFQGPSLAYLLEHTSNYAAYLRGYRLALSFEDIRELSRAISSSDVPIEYQREIKDKDFYSLPLEFGASLGVGFDLGVTLSYLEETSYSNASGYAVSDELLLTNTSVDLSGPIDDATFRIEELFTEVIPSLVEEVNEFFRQVGAHIQDGIETAWGWIEEKADSVKDWWISITYAPSEKGAWSQSSQITVRGSAGAAVMEGIGNYTKSKAATIGRPMLVTVEDASTGEQITDLSAEPLTFTIRYAPEDLAAAGISAQDSIVKRGGIAMYRYSDNGDYFEYVGGENDLEAMTVTAKISKTGQYVLAVDSCAPALTKLNISDFRQNPTITAVFDDMTGLDGSRFLFSLDGNLRVDGANLSDHYHSQTGVFTYTVPDAEALSEGEHTISFTLADTSGNAETYAYSFRVDLTAPVISDVTVSGTPNQGAEVSVCATVADSNLTAVYAVLSKRMADGTWSEEVTTAMGDMGDGRWGLDYEGDGSSIRVRVKALDIAENIAQSDVFEVKPYAQAISLEEEYIVLYRGQTTKLHAQVSPSELNGAVSWQVEHGGETIVSVDNKGNVTGLAAGTAYILATVSNGEYTLTARCRVDVTPQLLIDGIQLSTTRLTSELYSSNFAEFEILLHMYQNYPTQLQSMASSGSVMRERPAVAIGDAWFEDAAMNALFDLVVLDDRRVAVKPTEKAISLALENARNIKNSYTGIVKVRINGEVYGEESLTLTVKKTEPKLKAAIPAFNSFHTGQAHPISVTGGTVAGISLDPNKKQPDWLALNEDGNLVLTENAPARNLSDKAFLLVATEEWRIPAAVTLSVKNTYKAPALKLSASTVTVASDPANAEAIALTLLPRSKQDTLASLKVKAIKTETEGYQVTGYDPADGSFFLKTLEGFAPQKILLTVSFMDTNRTVSLNLTVKTKQTVLQLSAKSLCLNAAARDSGEVSITAAPSNCILSAPTIRLTDRSGTDKLASGELDIWYDSGKLTIRTTEKTPKNGSYKLYLRANGSAETVLSITTIYKAPSVTLKTSGALDLSFPETEALVCASFRNYASGEIKDFSWSVTEKKGSQLLNENAAGLFQVEQDGTTFRVRVKNPDSVHTDRSYSLKLRLTLNDGNIYEKSVNLKVKRTAVRLKLSATKLSLNKAAGDCALVAVRCLTAGYDLGVPVVSLMDKTGKTSAEGRLDYRYSAGQLTIAVNESTEPGSTYKLLVQANRNTPAAVLTITVPTEAKSHVTVSLKASGSLDVIRDGSSITVNPSYKNCTADADRTEELRIYSVKGKVSTPATELFDIQKNSSGSYVIAKAPGSHIDHTLKYQVQLVASFRDPAGERVTAQSAPISLKVTMGSAKLVLQELDTTIFARDKNDRATFQITASDAALNEVARIEMKDSRNSSLFEIHSYGNGEFALAFRDGAVDKSLQYGNGNKTLSIPVQIYLTGNSGSKANGTATLKVTVVRQALTTGLSILKDGTDISGGTVTLDVGQYIWFQGSSLPANAGKDFLWESSDPDVVRLVSLDGTFRGWKTGTAVISCTAKDGTGKTASVTVNVQEPVMESMSICTTFRMGKQITYEDLRLMVRYQNDWSELITEGYTCSPAVFNEAGTQKLTVSYAGITQTFAVEVLDFYERYVEIRNSFGEGYNEDRRAGWILYITGRLNGNRVDFNFWDSVPNLGGRYDSDWSKCWENACNGYGCEWGYNGTNIDEGFSQYWGGHAFMLPDDPSFAGTYTAELYFGQLTLPVTFSLKYMGDYETGTGWAVENVVWGG